MCYKDIEEQLKQVQPGIEEWNLTSDERAEFEKNEFGLTIQPQKQEGLEMVNISTMLRSIGFKTWSLLIPKRLSYDLCQYCPKMRPCLYYCRKERRVCETCSHQKCCNHHNRIVYEKLCPRHAYETWKFVIEQDQ